MIYKNKIVIAILNLENMIFIIYIEFFLEVNISLIFTKSSNYFSKYNKITIFIKYLNFAFFFSLTL